MQDKKTKLLPYEWNKCAKKYINTLEINDPLHILK